MALCHDCPGDHIISRSCGLAFYPICIGWLIRALLHAVNSDQFRQRLPVPRMGGSPHGCVHRTSAILNLPCDIGRTKLSEDLPRWLRTPFCGEERTGVGSQHGSGMRTLPEVWLTRQMGVSRRLNLFLLLYPYAIVDGKS